MVWVFLILQIGEPEMRHRYLRRPLPQGRGFSDAGGGFVTLQWCDFIRRAGFNQWADDLELEAVVAKTRSKKIR
jgi:hypothetical protein